jgi:hypothetical protein
MRLHLGMFLPCFVVDSIATRCSGIVRLSGCRGGMVEDTHTVLAAICIGSEKLQLRNELGWLTMVGN